MSLTVSVVLAVRDGEPYLAEAIDSVLAEGVHELVVVDDGSTDGTAAIIDGYGDRVVVLHQTATSQSSALNRGVAASTGELLAFQDADDVWVAGRQHRLLSALTEFVDVAQGAIEQFITPDLPADEAARLAVPDSPQASQMLTCLLIRRASFDAVGPFDESLLSAHNIDWISRAQVAGLRFASLPDVVLRRRVHAANWGRVRAAENRLDLTRVMRAHLNRTRAAR